jgi:hypothetical protein
MVRLIASKEFVRALKSAGIIGEGEHVRRVVIDALVDSPVIVYIERFGDDRLLQVARALDGVEITWTAP